jgi:hypothetical protein
MLLAFMIALAQDPDIQEAYRRDPVAVVSEREDLSEEEKSLLLSNNRSRLIDLLSAELRRNRFDMMFIAPTPAPWVYGRQTVTGFFWEPEEGALLLTIFATKLEDDTVTRCELRHGKYRIEGEVGAVEATPGGEKITLRFVLPPNAPPGTYWAYVNAPRNLPLDEEEAFVRLAEGDGMLNLHLGYEIGAAVKEDEP